MNKKEELKRLNRIESICKDLFEDMDMEDGIEGDKQVILDQEILESLWDAVYNSHLLQ